MLTIQKLDYRQRIKNYITEFIKYSNTSWGSLMYSIEEKENIAHYLKTVDPETVQPEEILIADSKIFFNNTKPAICKTCNTYTYELYAISNDIYLCDNCINEIYKFKENNKICVP